MKALDALPCLCGRDAHYWSYVKGFRFGCPRCKRKSIRRPTMKGAVLFWNRDIRELKATFYPEGMPSRFVSDRMTNKELIDELLRLPPHARVSARTHVSNVWSPESVVCAVVWNGDHVTLETDEPDDDRSETC